MEVNVGRKWCPGRVMREHRNGTFYVELDDGDDGKDDDTEMR